MSVARIEVAADQWSLPGGRRSRRPALSQARQRFVGHAVRWLRHMNMLEEPDAPRHRRADEVAAFEAWMRDERGWFEETIRGCLGTVDRFLEGLDEREVALGAIEAGDIDREATRWHARGCSGITVRDYAQRLRAFFWFAERRAWRRPGLAEGIMPPRFHPGEPLPKGLDREEVLRLLATAEGSWPADVRDRAILTVLIAYGLRAGEVAGLRLDDVDWEEETLRVRRPKLGRTHHYPLSRGVGQAILRYVRELRPSRPERTLFLTLSAPLRPLSGSAMSHVVRSRLDRIGITGMRRGPHALRHGAAQHLLDCGLSMKEVGGNVDCGSVREADVLSFLAGNGRPTRHRANKHGALAGFYRYAVSRGYAARSPLPATEDEPARPRSAPPYVYSRDELQRLFGAIEASRQRPVQLDADTLRALLLMLYGAGLRFGEAQRLTFDEVSLTDAVLTVRNTKFHKTRLVPVGPQLVDALRTYAAKRIERPLPEGGASTFLANLDGTPLAKRTVGDAFSKLLKAAGIRHNPNDGRRAPSLHSLRHAAAVHRLVAWHRQGADAQRLLPALSTWLGHAHLDGTQIYLSMTPELLQEASARFDSYVNGGGHD